jgi:hypothetical protein
MPNGMKPRPPGWPAPDEVVNAAAAYLLCWQALLVACGKAGIPIPRPIGNCMLRTVRWVGTLAGE